MKNIQPKPVRAWMAWNFNNPWPSTTRLTRHECIKEVQSCIQHLDKWAESFTVRKVTIACR